MHIYTAYTCIYILAFKSVECSICAKGTFLHTCSFFNVMHMTLLKRMPTDTVTGTCFIQKIYAPSSSLLQGKHLPFSPSLLCLNILFFAYLWSFRWPNYIVTLLRYFSLRLSHLNIPTGPPSEELDENISERSLFHS